MGRLTLGGLKVLGRRLAVQTLVSGTVMAGLNLAMHVDYPPLPWPLGGAMPVPEGPVGTQTKGEADDPGLVQHVRSVPIVTAGGKAGRLPMPRQELAAAPAAGEDASPVTRTVAATSQDVVLFDACMPRCESRDPLIAANRSPAEIPTPSAVLGARPIGDVAWNAPFSRGDTGLIDRVSSRLAAFGQAGYRAVSGRLASFQYW